MEEIEIMLGPGERGLLLGQTGSGKTVNAFWQARRTPQSPVVILNTKGDEIFFALPDVGHEDEADDDEFAIIESLRDFESILPRAFSFDYIIITPNEREMGEPKILDEYLSLVYAAIPGSFVVVDEGYQVHTGPRAGPGLIALLTRGRSKGITTLVGSQRPSWLSRFTLSEAQRYYIYNIVDRRDRVTIGEVIPGYESLPFPIPRYHFYYYEHSMNSAVLVNPVSYEGSDNREMKRVMSKESRLNWF